MDTESRLEALREAPHTGDIDGLAAAIQDPTRRRILLALVHDGRPRTVDEMAEVAGVHRTVAFGHLERLVALGHLEKRQRRGRRFGATLSRGPAPTIVAALRPLEQAGMDYTVDGDDVSTPECVFREACDEARDVVCTLHAGVLEGALGAAGIEAHVEPRGPVRATGCHFGVSRNPATVT